MPPDDTNVLQNHNISLVCAATSEPMHTTQWFKGDSITIIKYNTFCYVCVLISTNHSFIMHH